MMRRTDITLFWCGVEGYILRSVDTSEIFNFINKKADWKTKETAAKWTAYFMYK